MADELDTATLAGCRRGDPEAFRALVERYQDRVYALCVALAGGDDEDLTQETFVRVHGAIGDFDADGPARLGAWILTIARRFVPIAFASAARRCRSTWCRSATRRRVPM